ncbi:MAG: glycosyltransferase family 87 protein [Chloroflexota bacterium]
MSRLRSVLAMTASPAVQRAVADGLVIVGALWFFSSFFVWGEPATRTPFVDGLAYWGVDRDHPYATASVGVSGSFLYSPVAALAFGVIGLLPQLVFVGLWASLIVALTVWLGLPWPRIWLILLFPIARELLIGQFNVVATAAIVFGFGRPWLWAMPILTKVTPGVGILWFAVRREWRSLTIAVGVTATLAAASFAIRPDWWADWIALITSQQGNAGHQLPYLRYAIASAIVIWGARTDRPWTVPLGSFVALPVIYPDSFTFLLGCVAVRYASIRRAALGGPVTT